MLGLQGRLQLLRGRPSRASLFHTSSTAWASRKVLQKFKLADIGEGITECEVIKWNVKPPGVVQAFDQLCEVQSDKASVEITSPFDGVVKELLVQEGEVAKVGEGLCLIEVDEDSLDENAKKFTEPASPPLHQEQEAVQRKAFETRSEQPPSAPTPAQEPHSSRKRRPHPLDPNHPPDASTILESFSKNVLAKPAVRHLARELGVDLNKLAPGSGRDGRIEKEDLERYLAGGRKEESTTSTASAHQPQSSADVVVELGRTRYGMWKAMEKSLQIPHFGYSTTLDITNLHHILPLLNTCIPPHYLPDPPPSPYQAINPSAVHPAPSPPPVPASRQFSKLTYLPLFLKTLSKAMHEWPLFRASITPRAAGDTAKPTLTVRPYADISVALSTPTGLYTPTIQRVDTHSVFSLAAELKHLSHLGRQTPCGLTPAEMPRRGGTITVSNVGAIGAGDFASPVLVPGGGVAIVALGRAKWVWDVDRGDGKGERRLKIGVSWSADHRVVEGAELAAFVECWRAYVEMPERLIGEAV
ncbi:CoA-dependent acyltransferase [Gloeophyllum trabeum ATCC 11539]|uniref:Dihydrolipoamide acetyltransferase component of pyruvate dehydrogenase complex n=1 Tax=Gloeophyllum trabeum (strain ATCC 11539 / FP-39264 / Madison 617) TaxID=670483 RepID=S7QP13_GLOTA|nr:CoA-dependent acyltransferase [Gloeophyllum trabeum ATCC 11539]EPQ61263.1 CoA-dependent acyltransferase [Gloeophyllum trabeum ATCC 11539]